MNFRKAILLCCLASAAVVCPAQPDFALNATPVAPSAPKPAIARAADAAGHRNLVVVP